MLTGILAFEWRTHTRQVAFMAAVALFFAFGAVLAATGFGPANIDVNSPYSIAESLSLLSLLSVFVIAVFSASAIVRDREQRTEEIVFTTAVTRFDFLLGRFGGSFAAAVTVMAFSMPGMVAGALLRGNADGRTAAFRIVAYLWPFALMVVPSMLFVAALIFAVAALTRSALASHVAAVFVYAMYFVASALTNSPLMASSTAAGTTSGWFGALIDPFGLSAFFDATRYWTPSMRNDRLLALSGTLLLNRVLVVTAAVAILAFVYRRFAFRVLSGRSARATESIPTTAAGRSYRTVETHVRQKAAFVAQLRSELRSLFTSIPFLLIVLLWMILAAVEIAGDLSAEHGSALMATSSIVLGALAQPLRLIALIALIYFGMEIVWRERSSGMEPVVNATPASGASFALAKWFVLSTLVGTLVVAGLAVALTTQLLHGTKPEAAQYLWFAWIHGLPIALFAALTVFVHAASRRKYAGMLVVIVAALLLAAGKSMGISHNLWRFASAPSTEWSDMNGFGPHFVSFHAYMLHWAVVAALMLVVAAGVWRSASLRGLLRRSSSRAGRLPAAALVAAALITGSFILYNTTILNAHVTSAEMAEWKADYEKQYRPYAAVPQPRVERIEGEVSLYPGEQRARIRGRYVLVNQSGRPVERILVAVRRDARDVALSVSGARMSGRDARFGQTWFDLARPLPTGARTLLEFDVSFARRGFEEDAPDYSVASNGSYLTHLKAFPTIGYRATYELHDPAERRKHALPPREERVTPHGEDVPDDWVTFDITVSTDFGQTAVTSGQLVRTWNRSGRSYFHYRSHQPVPNAIDFTSARYATVRSQYRGIPVDLYYEPRHGANAQRILRAATGSLAVFEKAFGRYRFGELRLAEIPSYWPFGGFASPAMVVLPENRTFMTEPAGAANADLVVRRIAHEVAHQWWGHSVAPANVPGGTAIVETLTKYAEILALENLSGREAARQNAEFELDRYLRGRAEQVGSEPPLALVRDEPHIFYGKGTVVMSGLRDLLGEEQLNRALTLFLVGQSGPGKAATTRDLLSSIATVASDEERQLIASWFEKIVLYDIELLSADARKRGDGKYDVALRIRAARTEARPDGHESPQLMREAIAVSMRTDERELQTIRPVLVSGDNEVHLVIDALPTSVIIDPDVTRVDTNRTNNAKQVKVSR